MNRYKGKILMEYDLEPYLAKNQERLLGPEGKTLEDIPDEVMAKIRNRLQNQAEEMLKIRITTAADLDIIAWMVKSTGERLIGERETEIRKLDEEIRKLNREVANNDN